MHHAVTEEYFDTDLPRGWYVARDTVKVAGPFDFRHQATDEAARLNSNGKEPQLQITPPVDNT